MSYMNVVLVMSCCRLKKQKKMIERKKKNYTSVRESRFKGKETNKQASERMKKLAS